MSGLTRYGVRMRALFVLLWFAVGGFLSGCPGSDEPADGFSEIAATEVEEAEPDLPSVEPDAPPDSPDIGSAEVSVVLVGVGSGDIKPLLGVVSGPDATFGSDAPNVALSLQEIGITQVRNTDYFDDRLDIEQILVCQGQQYPAWDACLERDDGPAFDLLRSDVQFQSWATNGLEPFLRLGGEAVNEEVAHEFSGPQTESQEAAWILAAEEVVNHYDGFDGVAGRLDWVQVWDTFGGDGFWDRSNDALVSFWVEAFATIDAVFEDLRVGGPGFADEVGESLLDGEAGLAGELLEALHENGTPPDWIGFQVHSDDPGEVLAVAQAWRRLLDGAGSFDSVPWTDDGFFAATALVADKWGLGSANAGKAAAARATAGWIALQHAGVERAFYDRCADRFSAPADPDKPPERGLFYATGSYKRAAHAVRLWSRFVDSAATRLSSDASTGDLWLLAGEGGDGARVVLVANVGDGDATWRPTFGSEPADPADHAAIEMWQVDGGSDGKVSSEWTEPVMVTPPGTVQLWRFSP